MESDGKDCIDNSSDDNEKESLKKIIKIKKNMIYKFIEIKIINIPVDLKIDKYYYHFKYHTLDRSNYIYRCKYATYCKVPIKIDIDNMTKLLDSNTDDNYSIEYSFINIFRHTCKINKDTKKEKINYI